MIPPDQLQNFLILIAHHVDDAIEALEGGEDDIAQASLVDIGEITNEMKTYLPERLASQITIESIARDTPSI